MKLNDAISYAQQRTAEAVKARLERSTENNAFRAIAKELNAGKGYIICTPRELNAKYPDLFALFNTNPNYTDAPRVWCVSYNGYWKELQFECVYHAVIGGKAKESRRGTWY